MMKIEVPGSFTETPGVWRKDFSCTFDQSVAMLSTLAIFFGEPEAGLMYLRQGRIYKGAQGTIALANSIQKII